MVVYKGILTAKKDDIIGFRHGIPIRRTPGNVQSLMAYVKEHPDRFQGSAEELKAVIEAWDKTQKRKPRKRAKPSAETLKAREVKKLRKRYWRVLTRIWLAGDIRLAADMITAVIVPKGKEKAAVKKAFRLLKKAEAL
jgi:hypothetical protein